MGKTADLTVFQIINILQESRPWKLNAEKAVCVQRSVSNGMHGKLTGREKCGRKKCTNSLERTVKKRREHRRAVLQVNCGCCQSIKSHRPQTSLRKELQICRSPHIVSLLNQRQCQKHLTWDKEKNSARAQWSKVFSSDEKKVSFLLKINFLEFWERGRVESHKFVKSDNLEFHVICWSCWRLVHWSTKSLQDTLCFHPASPSALWRCWFPFPAGLDSTCLTTVA